MINFSVGPVQMNETTRDLGRNQIPYFRTREFSKIMKENEKLLCNFFDAPDNSRVIFLTGSGTSSMEGGVMNFFTKEDKSYYKVFLTNSNAKIESDFMPHLNKEKEYSETDRWYTIIER